MILCIERDVWERPSTICFGWFYAVGIRVRQLLKVHGLQNILEYRENSSWMKYTMSLPEKRFDKGY